MLLCPFFGMQLTSYSYNNIGFSNEWWLEDKTDKTSDKTYFFLLLLLLLPYRLASKLLWDVDHAIIGRLSGIKKKKHQPHGKLHQVQADCENWVAIFHSSIRWLPPAMTDETLHYHFFVFLFVWVFFLFFLYLRNLHSNYFSVNLVGFLVYWCLLCGEDVQYIRELWWVILLMAAYK